MVRILGNSPERVRINDLGDVIYYRQQKDYTDQEFDSSRDLQREVQKGRVTILERFNAPRGSAGVAETVVANSSQIGLREIKQAVREVLPEVSGQQQQAGFMSMIKGVLDTFKQELSSMARPVYGSTQVEESRSRFTGPEYVPDISTEGMISNVKAEERTSDGNDVDSALDVLRNLNK